MNKLLELQNKGKLAREKLLFGKDAVPSRAFVTVEDALWVGEVEPRVLELLPAVIFRRPKLFAQVRPLPPDLARVIKELKRDRAQTDFRGIPAKQYEQWVDRVGRRAIRPAVTKIHRFTDRDREEIRKLMTRWNVSETEAIRRAIHHAVVEGK